MWRYIYDGDDYASDDDENDNENENVEEEADDNDVEEVGDDDVEEVDDDDVDDENQVLHPITAQCRVAIGSSVYCPMGSYLPTPVTAGSS